ncbi:hypothetical protein SAMN02910315_01132 [Methanobrevibacter millerae]|uniref:Adhesin-like protein n=2 Tax=Methanobrevibacter millerae TaxID=230361 RepID=A0A1G5W3W7_9EURY|nr:hypothetical protein SAMN02910315_01132 [Methanobrevibacter millerae]
MFEKINEKVDTMIKKTGILIFIFLTIFLTGSVSASELENETMMEKSITQDSVHIETSDVEMFYKDGTRFTAQIHDKKPISNATVVFSLNGVDYKRQSNEYGLSSIALNLNSGKYSITTTSYNISVNNTIDIKSTIYSSDVVKIYRNSTQYYARFIDDTGDALKNTPVSFNINGVYYTRMTNENGVARLNLNLEQGSYILTAINPKTTEMISNNITILPTITNNRDLVKYYRNDSRYSVTVLEKNGERVGSGHEVEFNINGVLYYRQTDVSGTASLNINLNPGEYIITAHYDGCRVSNRIRVLSTLTAKDVEMTYKDGTKFKAYLVDGKGNALENEKVTFNINGVFYTRTTDINGMASLNINLQTGSYIITSENNGLMISNKIIITEKIKESIKNTPFTYEIGIPNYVNVTYPYVSENSVYTIESGINGIIRMEKNQLINIQIGYKYYTFSTGYMPEYSATYLGSEYYLLPFDSSPTQHSYRYENLTGNGLILHRSANYTHFIYRNNCTSNVEQFGAYIDKGPDKSEIITYIQNGECVAKVSFQTMSFDELGVKYAISKYNGCSIYDFNYKSYDELTKGNKIRFANTGEEVSFDYFGKKITGYISEENIVTRFSSANCIEFEKEELITYGLSDKYKRDFDVMQSFAIINTKMTDGIIRDWISRESEYKSNAGIQSLYTMFLTDINTCYLSDALADELTREYEIRWMRGKNTVILGAMNWENTYQHILTPDMGRIIIADNESDIISFRFVNSILLSKIEERSLMPIAQDADVEISSVFDEIFNSISSYKVSVVYYNNTAVISDESVKSVFLIDLTTGLVTPLSINDGFAYKGVTISRDCGLCSIASTEKGVLKNVNNGLMQINSVLDYISDNIQPLTTLIFKGALISKGFIGVLLGGGLSLGLGLVGTASGIQGIGVYFAENYISDNDLHTAYDHFTFTRPGYLQNTKIYNIPTEDGRVDYIEIPIKSDNSYDRENVKYISNGNVRTLTKKETYNYFTEESWDAFSVPQKYWR